MHRRTSPWALLGLAAWLAAGCSGTPGQPGDEPGGPEGEGEGGGEVAEGEGEGEGEGGEGEGEGGEGEGEGSGGEGEGEGEGEGTERPDGGTSDPPDLGDWSGYRTLPLVCGSVEPQVVRPGALTVTATVVLGGPWCAAHLEAGSSGERQIFVKAVPSADGPASCGDGQFRRTLTLAIPDLTVGEWTVAMRGDDQLLLRRRVQVLPEGADLPVPGPTCVDGRVGFVGSCGVDLFCEAGAGCEASGRCVSGQLPQPLAGSYPVRFDNLDKRCLDAQAQPPQEFEHPLQLGAATMVISVDPADAARGTVTFADDPLLAHFAVPVTISGFTFVSSGEARFVDHGSSGCTRSYQLTLAGQRSDATLVGRLALNEVELYCGRSVNPLRCELTADFAP